MNDLSMILPRWTTFVIFVALVLQFLLSWIQAKKTGRSVRGAVLPGALMASGMSIVLVREFFGDLPGWIEAPLFIISALLILIALILLGVRLTRFLRQSWQLERKNDK